MCHELTMPLRKFAEIDFHKEAYVSFVGYFVIVSDQKFLIHRFKDKGVTVMMIHVQNLVAPSVKYYVVDMEVFSTDASFLGTVEYPKEVPSQSQAEDVGIYRRGLSDGLSQGGLRD